MHAPEFPTKITDKMEVVYKSNIEKNDTSKSAQKRKMFMPDNTERLFVFHANHGDK